MEFFHKLGEVHEALEDHRVKLILFFLQKLLDMIHLQIIYEGSTILSFEYIW